MLKESQIGILSTSIPTTASLNRLINVSTLQTPTLRRKHHSPAMATNGSSTGSEENVGGSLTDLVSDFDEKIKQCFKVA